MKKLDIDKKNLIVPFFIILMSIIFIIESIFNKSFTNKIIMASIIIVTVYLFFKNKFDKKNYFFTALVIAFFFIFIIEKILSSSNIEITYIIFKFFEIILFPYSIFILLNIPKSKKLNDILTILISTMFFCFFLLF